MDRIVSSFGQKEAPKPQGKFDLSLADDVKCNHCGCYTFTQVSLLKHFSAVTSPTGEEGYLPLVVWACTSCNNVNDGFLPAGYVEAFKQKQLQSQQQVKQQEVPTPTGRPSLKLEK